MREVRMVSLHFDEAEIIEALELLCHKHHPAVAVNFVRQPAMVMGNSGNGREIVLTFNTDTHPAVPEIKSSDETRIFPVKRR